MSVIDYLPHSTRGGVLPYWVTFVSALGLYNVWLTHKPSQYWQLKEIWGNKPHELTPVAARVFGLMGLTTLVLRMTAMYHLDNQPLYDLMAFSYGVVAYHFWSELLYYRSMRFGRASLTTLIVAPVTCIWAIVQRSHYLGL